MSEWYDSQKQSIGNVRKLLHGRIEKANPRRELTSEEAKRLAKLEAIADKLKRGENVQNCQLQNWLSGDECERCALSVQNPALVPWLFAQASYSTTDAV